jgi:hypothetical protein
MINLYHLQISKKIKYKEIEQHSFNIFTNNIIIMHKYGEHDRIPDYVHKIMNNPNVSKQI